MLTGSALFNLYRNLRFGVGGDGVSVRTLTGNLTLTTREEQLCSYDPGGASRNVTIHADDNQVGMVRAFYNSADADGENLVIKNSAGTTICTVGRGETGIVAYGGSTPAWKILLLTDGTADILSTANSWSAEQTFGAGIALLDSDAITLGTGDDDTLAHDGTQTLWTHATGDWVFDNTDVNDQTIFRLGTDTSATGFEVRNNSDAAIFSVTGDGAVAMGGQFTTAALVTGDFSAPQYLFATITVPNSAAGVNDVLASLIVRQKNANGDVPAGTPQVMILAKATQYAPSALAAPVSTVTFSLATTGSIIASGAGWCLAQCAAGGFACTISDSADETVYFSVVSAEGVSGSPCVVVGSNVDAATWSA
jgi:hypothetical protein